MAACATGRRPALVASLLAATDEKQYKSAMIKLQSALEPCLVNAAASDSRLVQMTFSRFDIVGLMAEAALTRSPPPSYPSVAIVAVPRAPGWLARRSRGARRCRRGWGAALVADPLQFAQQVAGRLPTLGRVLFEARADGALDARRVTGGQG